MRCPVRYYEVAMLAKVTVRCRALSQTVQPGTIPIMSTAPPTDRRWFQFGMGTIAWLVVVIALAVYGVNEHRLRRGVENENAALQDAVKAAYSFAVPQAEFFDDLQKRSEAATKDMEEAVKELRQQRKIAPPTRAP